MTKTQARRGKRGFRRAGTLVEDRIRRAGETRGFAVARLLTHWPDVAGPELAGITRPVKVGYTRGAFGATLTVLVPGAEAPFVAMQAEALRARVNACYGYAAISRIQLTQTAPEGFSDGQSPFAHKATEPSPAEPRAEITARAARETREIDDAGLRAALEALGSHILTRSEKQDRNS